MTGAVVQNNLTPNQPQLKDLLDLFRRDILLNFNCHAVGTVQSFDPVKQIASVTINYKKTFFVADSQGVYQPKLVDYPLLLDAPVIFLGGGGTALTFPVAQGDECLVFFNDRDIDTWFNGSSGSAVNTPRLHSFADGLILVGPRSLANVVTEFDPVNPQLKCQNLTATFRVAGGFRVENNIGWWDFNDDADIQFDTGTVVGRFGHGGHVKFQNSFGELIDTLINLMTTIQTANCASPGNPLVMPAFAAFLTILQSFKEP